LAEAEREYLVASYATRSEHVSVLRDKPKDVSISDYIGEGIDLQIKNLLQTWRIISAFGITGFFLENKSLTPILKKIKASVKREQRAREYKASHPQK